jgi:glycosyltransferase involved in cell wall biosynthesis
MKLTIAIPTYNRVEYLKELLPEIIAQCKPYPDIEILVSDNGTTDGTFPYLLSLADNEQLQYRANETNLGADTNFIQCVEAAKGEYIWLFGDDDVISPQGIDNVMQAITRYHPHLIIVGIPGQKGTYLNYRSIIKDKDPAFVIDHTLITCNIFRRDIFNKQVAYDRMSTRYGVMYAIMDSVVETGPVHILNKTVFTVRDNRPPFDGPPKWMRLKHIQYLLYLGVPITDIVNYYYHLVRRKLL